MNMLSSKTRLSVKVMVGIASAPPSETVTVQALSTRLHVSVSHLESITGTLRRARHLTRRLRQADEAVSQPLLGVHCLVVDDSEINLEIAARLLTQRGARTSKPSGPTDMPMVLRRLRVRR